MRSLMRNGLRYGALAGALGMTACELEVDNPNDPETQRVVANPVDLQDFIGRYYNRWHQGMYNTTTNVWGMMTVQSLENYSSLANNCMNQRAAIPRGSNDNAIGNVCEAEQKAVYNRNSEVMRVASGVIATVEESTLGNAALDARAKSFAEFLRGVSLGYTALLHDSAAVVSTATATDDPGEMVGYQTVMDSALAALKRSGEYATAGAAAFPLPATWIPSTTSLTAAEFTRLTRSYAARFRAGVARSPQERAAVNWDQVIADAQAGITADHDNITNAVTGPFNNYVNTFHGFGTWHQMTPFVIGMGDVSGAYATWLAMPLDSRPPGFTMVTPDLRFPQGNTRAEQQADFAITSCQGAGQTCKRYFVNRPTGNDPSGGLGWGQSNYDFTRFISWARSGDAGSPRNGKLVFMTKAEMDMLEAEGHMRKGNFAAAAALINKTRVRNGLPAITAFDATSPVPGGATNCVPKVPQGPSFTTVACGTMFEAMKWEKRLETAYTHFGAWFWDSRGWGDLPAGTPVDWAVPYQDLQARLRPIYSKGGGINPGSAPKGTYGW
jgi:hypothetical protein